MLRRNQGCHSCGDLCCQFAEIYHRILQQCSAEPVNGMTGLSELQNNEVRPNWAESDEVVNAALGGSVSFND